MNTRFLTLLTALVFLGFTVSAFAVKPDCEDTSSTHPKCNPDSGGDTYPLYEVTIDGEVTGRGSISGSLPWLWTYDGRWMGSGGSGQLNLDFFRTGFPAGPFNGADGANCFPTNVDIFSGGFRKHKHSTADGMFWFDGFAADGETAVFYLLRVTGHFFEGRFKDWPENQPPCFLRVGVLIQ